MKSYLEDPQKCESMKTLKSIFFAIQTLFSNLAIKESYENSVYIKFLQCDTLIHFKYLVFLSDIGY